ncbi:MAG: hypothetical protein HUJ56_06030, partial [Erysipelotrichaceae bacterium]|nr:hypothetical protein [Erysipelotrichaceae bacterium]
KEEIKRKAKLSGREEYFAESREEGRQEGREEGIAGAILICRNLGAGFEKTVKQIANQFKMDMSEAETITRKYWEFD